MDLTKSEENILEILLDSDTPLSKSGILEHAPKDKCWKDGSIHILLNSLLEKELFMRLVLSEPEKASEEPSLLHKRDFPTFLISCLIFRKSLNLTRYFLN